jgi:hypothetical protein
LQILSLHLHANNIVFPDVDSLPVQECNGNGDAVTSSNINAGESRQDCTAGLAAVVLIASAGADVSSIESSNGNRNAGASQDIDTVEDLKEGWASTSVSAAGA